MIGNLIITSHPPIGNYLQMGCVAFAVWNEMREKEQTTIPAPTHAESLLKRAITNLMLSPGIYRHSLLWVFRFASTNSDYAEILLSSLRQQ
jgi:hypothetical protein